DEVDLKRAILRELEEETGSTSYRYIKQYDEKICFEFPDDIRTKIGYEKQETTMFHFEYSGDETCLQPLDNEIDDIRFTTKENVLHQLTHDDTKNFFVKYFFI
ncbi:MAG: NUDIX domain-containing protein, partial [Bacillaceae bacterium]